MGCFGDLLGGWDEGVWGLRLMGCQWDGCGKNGTECRKSRAESGKGRLVVITYCDSVSGDSSVSLLGDYIWLGLLNPLQQELCTL